MQQKKELQPCYEEDEIDLRELLKTIMKYKKFILFFTTIITLTAVIYAFTKTPAYEARALLEIGKYKIPFNSINSINSINNINNNILIENASELSQTLNFLFIDMYKNKKDLTTHITSIKVPKGQKNFIEIKAESISNTLASNGIKKVIGYIEKKHRNILDNIAKVRILKIKNITNRIDNIKTNEIRLLKQNIAAKEALLKKYQQKLNILNENIKRTEKTNPALTAITLINQKNLSDLVLKLNTQIIDLKNKENVIAANKILKLEEEKSILKSSLPKDSDNSHIVGNIITNNYPIKPKKKLIIMVAFVTGLILSIFLVFFMEFLKSVKEGEMRNQGAT